MGNFNFDVLELNSGGRGPQAGLALAQLSIATKVDIKKSCVTLDVLMPKEVRSGSLRWVVSPI